MGERRFPVLLSYTSREQTPYYIRTVPWSFVAPHEKQAQCNHGGQTLERLAERGGLNPWEMVAVVTGKRWHEMSDTKDGHDAAKTTLLDLVALHEFPERTPASEKGGPRDG